MAHLQEIFLSYFFKKWSNQGRTVMSLKIYLHIFFCTDLTHICTVFGHICTDLAYICTDFAHICTDFAQICRFCAYLISVNSSISTKLQLKTDEFGKSVLYSSIFFSTSKFVSQGEKKGVPSVIGEPPPLLQPTPPFIHKMWINVFFYPSLMRSISVVWLYVVVRYWGLLTSREFL